MCTIQWHICLFLCFWNPYYLPYRTNPTTRDDIFLLLKRRSDRLWEPISLRRRTYIQSTRGTFFPHIVESVLMFHGRDAIYTRFLARGGARNRQRRFGSLGTAYIFFLIIITTFFFFAHLTNRLSLLLHLISFLTIHLSRWADWLASPTYPASITMTTSAVHTYTPCFQPLVPRRKFTPGWVYTPTLWVARPWTGSIGDYISSSLCSRENSSSHAYSVSFTVEALSLCHCVSQYIYIKQMSFTTLGESGSPEVK